MINKLYSCWEICWKNVCEKNEIKRKNLKSSIWFFQFFFFNDIWKNETVERLREKRLITGQVKIMIFENILWPFDIKFHPICQQK